MSPIIYVLIGFLFFILLGLTVWFFIEKFKDKDDPSDDTFFINCMPQYSNGHKFGIIDEIIEGDKRIGIKFYPRDIDYVKLLRGNKKQLIIEPEIVFFEKERLINIPKGTWSSHRNEIWGFPPSSEQLPIFFKSSEMGMKMVEFLEKENKKKDIKEILIDKDKSNVEFLKEINHKIPNKAFKLYQEGSKLVVKDLTKDKVGSYGSSSKED